MLTEDDICEDKTYMKLLHAVTAFDRRLEQHEKRRGWIVNIYRISHYIGALEGARVLVMGGKSWEDALSSVFCRGLLLDVCRVAIGLPRLGGRDAHE